MCSLHFFSDMVLVLERLSTKIPKSFLTSIAFNSHRTLIQNKSLTGLLCLSKLWLDNHCLREGFRKRLVTIYMWYTTLYTFFSTFCVYLSSLPKPLWLNLFLSLCSLPSSVMIPQSDQVMVTSWLCSDCCCNRFIQRHRLEHHTRKLTNST